MNQYNSYFHPCKPLHLLNSCVWGQVCMSTCVHTCCYHHDILPACICCPAERLAALHEQKKKITSVPINTSLPEGFAWSSHLVGFEIQADGGKEAGERGTSGDNNNLASHPKTTTAMVQMWEPQLFPGVFLWKCVYVCVHEQVCVVFVCIHQYLCAFFVHDTLKLRGLLLLAYRLII